MRNATLTIEGQTFNLLDFSYSFERDTDSRGRPSSAIRGGTFIVTMESTSNVELFRWMLGNKPKKPREVATIVSGKIEVADLNEGMIFKQFVFDTAIIADGSMHFNAYGGWPQMVETFRIVAFRLDINKFFRLDRRGLNGTGYSWREYVPEEQPEMFVRPEKKVVNMYWSYGPSHTRLPDGARSRHYADLNLHVLTENCNNGDTLSVTIESDSGDPVHGSSRRMSLAGSVDNNSLILENVFQTVNLNL